MIKVLENVITRAATWSKEAQEELARVAHEIEQVHSAGPTRSRPTSGRRSTKVSLRPTAASSFPTRTWRRSSIALGHESSLYAACPRRSPRDLQLPLHLQSARRIERPLDHPRCRRVSGTGPKARPRYRCCGGAAFAGRALQLRYLFPGTRRRSANRSRPPYVTTISTCRSAVSRASMSSCQRTGSGAGTEFACTVIAYPRWLALPAARCCLL